jgi:hypothetical protein
MKQSVEAQSLKVTIYRAHHTRLGIVGELPWHSSSQTFITPETYYKQPLLKGYCRHTFRSYDITTQPV